ncbi:helix-turn-helix transcriptional regulator [Archangium violaceum]|uniref:helix-turn-helix domain-containing protein n=1 Tax=Archangium violaceum TaxID=83451 RepID=UPI00193C7231|nr:AraC family transcriptional regulator [Archangium violaceum]QRK06304.1 helix-turn-helix transcriptional regulator [Archangium violaceum]
MSTPLRAVSDGPLSIRVFLPPELPGLRVVRYRTDERLWRSVKERFSVTMTYSGRSEWWCRGEVRVSTPGTLDLKQLGDVHRDLRREGPSRFQVISFDEALVTEAREALGYPASSHLRRVQLERGQPTAAPFVRLHALLGEGRVEPSNTLELQTALTEALCALASCFGDSDEPERRSRLPVRRALEALHEALEQGISLDALARQAELDKFHLCRAFREEVGMPPYAYLTHLRIARAMGLLTQGLTPSEVALRVGLYDQSQLNRHFKRIIGLTPGQFARAVQPRSGDDPGALHASSCSRHTSSSRSGGPVRGWSA